MKECPNRSGNELGCTGRLYFISSPEVSVMSLSALSLLLHIQTKCGIAERTTLHIKCEIVESTTLWGSRTRRVCLPSDIIVLAAQTLFEALYPMTCQVHVQFPKT